MPSPTSTQMLRTSILPLSPTITHFIISHLHFGSIFLQASHPLFDVVCFCRGLVYLPCSLGIFWVPGLSSLFHTGICDGSITFLDSTHCHFHLSLSPGPIDWATQVESNIPCVTKRKSLFECCQPTMKITSLGAKTTAYVIHSSRASRDISPINNLVHAWGGGGWSPPPSPKVTLTWMQ